MPVRRLRCFVAMAFGHADTDHVYRCVIAPTLRALSMQPIRVDRREHNENINDVIMRELDAAAFIIADLTYARPSVYYEAGYGERKSPVIYTVRRDHLRSTDDTQRVHFDVSMRNIIAWTPSTHAAFSKALRSRALHVTRPIREKVTLDDKATQAAHEFQHLSLSQRRSLLVNTVEKELARRGYTLLDRISVPRDVKCYWRRAGRKLEVAMPYVATDTTIRDFARAAYGVGLREQLFDTRALARHLRGLARLRFNALFASTSRVTRATVDKQFPLCTRDSATGALLHAERQFQMWRDRSWEGSARNEEWSVPMEWRAHVLDNIQSLPDFTGRLRSTLQSPSFRA